MKRLNRILSWDDCYIEGFALLFGILGFGQPLWWLPMGLYLYAVRRLIRWRIFVILMIGLGCLYGWITSYRMPEMIDQVGTVHDIQEKTYHDELTISVGLDRYTVRVSKDVYKVGHKVHIIGKPFPYRKATMPYGFDAHQYYLSQGIRGYLEVEQLKIVDASWHPMTFRTHLKTQYLTLTSSEILSGLIFGERSMPKEDETLFRDLGVLYLLTVSGIHVFGLTYLIGKVCFYLNLPKHIQSYVFGFFYLCLLYLSAGSIAMIRVTLMFLLGRYLESQSIRHTRYDLFHITCLIMIIMNPFLMFHQGMLLTYVIISAIYLMEIRYRGLIGYQKRFVISLIIALVLLPFERNLSMLTLLILPILIGLFTYLLYPMAWLIMVVPSLDPLCHRFLTEVIGIIKDMTTWQQSFTWSAMGAIGIFTYFSLLILLFRSKTLSKTLMHVLMIIVFLIGYNLYQTSRDQVIFLDVGQGDGAILIHDRCVTVIDAYQNVDALLSNLGFHQIDHLVLTHSDTDHTKEAEYLISNKHVKHVILSSYDHGYQHYTVKTSRMSSGDSFACGRLVFHVLGPLRPYEHPNNNSLVIQVRFVDQVFLFAGDIEEMAENELIAHYGHRLKSDVLKVAHHGSETSSSARFVHIVDPDHVIVSVGYKNRFSFPSQDVILRLFETGALIHRTDLQGSIVYQSSKKKGKWIHYLPFQGDF